jgi:hypothetical protein
MNSIQRQWNLLSERLGVKPKQFAVLLGVLAIAIVGLGLKYAPSGSQVMPQASIEKLSTDTAANQNQTGEPRVSTVSFAGAETPVSAQIIEMTLDSTPSRDPFRAVGAPEVEATKVAYTPVVAPTKTPGLLPGMMLKAVIRGELAVFGDQTVRIGDAIALPDGTFASVRAIADRSVTVEYDSRLIEVCFGAASQAKTNPAGGLK